MGYFLGDCNVFYKYLNLNLLLIVYKMNKNNMTEPKNNLVCDICNYRTSDKSNFQRHNKNLKHMQNCVSEVDKLKKELKQKEFEYKHQIDLLKKENEKLEAIVKTYESIKNKK